MTLAALLALASAAWAAPALVPPTGPRTVKIDLFSADPRSHPWGSDWKVTVLEQWTAVLSCQREAKVERCRFVDGTWWSVVVVGSDQRVSIHLPAPGELEFVWNPRGRLSTWDVTGDRSAFWTAASNAMLSQLFHRPDMTFKPDAQRAIGVQIEQSLTRGLAGALEWELPKTGDPEGGWAPTQTPWVARRWLQSTSSPKLRLAVAGDDGGRTALSMAGTVIERSTETSVVDLAVVTTVAGSASLDPQAGIVRARVETATVPTGAAPLTGHVRSITLVEPWTEGASAEPADVPAFALP